MIPLFVLPGQTIDLRRTLAAGPNDAVLMAPPQVASAAGAKRMAWTADGGYLVVLRETASSVELIAWGRRSGKSRLLATYDPASTKVGEIQPMGGSDRFVLETTERVAEGTATVAVQRIALVSASSGTSVPLSLHKAEKEDVLIEAYPSPKRPIGILERIDDRSKRYRVYGPDGRLGPEISVPRTEGFRYDEDGYPVQMRRIGDPKTGEGRTMERRIDLVTGAAGDWHPRARVPAVEKDAPLSVRALAIEGGKGVRAPGVLLAMWGGKDDESGLVSTDGTSAILSPLGDAVAYFDQSLAMVRTLTRVGREAYDDAIRLQRIAEAVQRAKQVGIGLLQYAADHDDVLPGQGVDVRNLTLSYVKDPSQYEGFTYTFAGGSQSEIDQVASTEMGYVSGPGGRAVIYTDGHVKWRPDP